MSDLKRSLSASVEALNLPPDIQHLAEAKIAEQLGLADLGFTFDEYGQLIAENCRVIFYQECDVWQVTIKLANGHVVSLDEVPCKAVTTRTAAELAARREGRFVDRKDGASHGNTQ